jgi:hypothetical protein
VPWEMRIETFSTNLEEETLRLLSEAGLPTGDLTVDKLQEFSSCNEKRWFGYRQLQKQKNSIISVPYPRHVIVRGSSLNNRLNL